MLTHSDIISGTAYDLGSPEDNNAIKAAKFLDNASNLESSNAINTDVKSIPNNASDSVEINIRPNLKDEYEKGIK